jgi:hypothetical protein
MLMAGVGRQIQSGGQRTVKVRILHEKGDVIAQAVTRISKELHQIRSITERWSDGACCSPGYSAAGAVGNGSPAY